MAKLRAGGEGRNNLCNLCPFFSPECFKELSYEAHGIFSKMFYSFRCLEMLYVLMSSCGKEFYSIIVQHVTIPLIDF